MIDDVRMPVDIEQGAKGGPTFFTTVITNTLGREQRNQNWFRPRGLYDVSYGIQSDVQYDAILSFFMARAGRGAGFRFKDWSDFKAKASIIGVGDGTQTQFQLVRTYPDPVRPLLRRITRPVAETVVVKVAGVATAFSAQPLGKVNLGAAPPLGAVVTADFEFDLPVRFDTDAFELEVPTVTTGVVGSLKIKEVME